MTPEMTPIGREMALINAQYNILGRLGAILHSQIRERGPKW